MRHEDISVPPKRLQLQQMVSRTGISCVNCALEVSIADPKKDGQKWPCPHSFLPAPVRHNFLMLFRFEGIAARANLKRVKSPSRVDRPARNANSV